MQTTGLETSTLLESIVRSTLRSLRSACQATMTTLLVSCSAAELAYGQCVDDVEGSEVRVLQAAPADTFADIVGINIHANWTGTLWETRAEEWRRAIGELGVRYVRTDVGTIPAARDSLLDLFESYGVRVNVLINPRKSDRSLDEGRLIPFLEYIRDQIGTEKVLWVEGPNEYNSTEARGNSDWSSQLIRFQSELYDRIKDDPQTADLIVIAPSIFRRIVADYTEIKELASKADIANLHYYTGGNKPTRYRRDGITAELGTAIEDAQGVVPGKGVMITETGYEVARPSAPGILSEVAASKYILRLLAESFQRGVSKVFIYSLIDDPDNSFGLMKGDLSKRMSYFSVRNIISLLADQGPAIRPPNGADLRVCGYLQDISTVFLQKRDGRSYLIAWNDSVSFYEHVGDLEAPMRKLMLDLQDKGLSRVNVYYPTSMSRTDQSAIQPVLSTSFPSFVTIDVPDHLAVVEMIP